MVGEAVLIAEHRLAMMEESGIVNAMQPSCHFACEHAELHPHIHMQNPAAAR
jgi:hypothetical protein